MLKKISMFFKSDTKVKSPMFNIMNSDLKTKNRVFSDILKRATEDQMRVMRR